MGFRAWSHSVVKIKIEETNQPTSGQASQSSGSNRPFGLWEWKDKETFAISLEISSEVKVGEKQNVSVKIIFLPVTYLSSLLVISYYAF